MLPTMKKSSNFNEDEGESTESAEKGKKSIFVFGGVDEATDKFSTMVSRLDPESFL